MRPMKWATTAGPAPFLVRNPYNQFSKPSKMHGGSCTWGSSDFLCSLKGVG